MGPYLSARPLKEAEIQTKEAEIADHNEYNRSENSDFEHFFNEKTHD